MVGPPPWLGRRGAVLLLIGTTWLVQGVGILAGGWQPIPLPPIHDAIPLLARAALWVGAGGLAVLAATRRHPGRDTYGFAAAITVPSTMVALWLADLVWSVASRAPGERIAGGAVAAYTWATVAMLLLTTAGWAETPRGFAPPHDDDRSPDAGGDGEDG